MKKIIAIILLIVPFAILAQIGKRDKLNLPKGLRMSNQLEYSYNTDDNTGRQRWKLAYLGTTGGNEYFNINIEDGTPSDHTFLSTSGGGQSIDLYSMDDGSGRQKWILKQA